MLPVMFKVINLLCETDTFPLMLCYHFRYCLVEGPVSELCLLVTHKLCDG